MLESQAVCQKNNPKEKTPTKKIPSSPPQKKKKVIQNETGKAGKLAGVEIFLNRY